MSDSKTNYEAVSDEKLNGIFNGTLLKLHLNLINIIREINLRKYQSVPIASSSKTKVPATIKMSRTHTKHRHISNTLITKSNSQSSLNSIHEGPLSNLVANLSSTFSTLFNSSSTSLSQLEEKFQNLFSEYLQTVEGCMKMLDLCNNFDICFKFYDLLLNHLLYELRFSYDIIADSSSELYSIISRINFILFKLAFFQTSPKYSLLHDVSLPSCDIAPENNGKVLFTHRHPIDLRYAKQDLISKSNYSEVSRLYSTFQSLESSTNDYSSIHIATNNCCYSSCLTATYPLVVVESLENPSSPTSGESLSSPKYKQYTLPDETCLGDLGSECVVQLLNDPNCDGYLCLSVLCDGNKYTIGATVDGSGSGFHAKVAGELVLSCLYQMVSYGINPENPLGNSAIFKKYEPYTLKKNPFKSTHDIFKFLEKTCMFSQEVISSCDNTGACTACFYVLSKVQDAPFQTERFSSEKDCYICCYAVAGDADLFYFSCIDQKWKQLSMLPPSSYMIKSGFLQPPATISVPGGELRFNTSYTPGGIGKSHGDQEKIYGALYWEDYLHQIRNNIKNQPVSSDGKVKIPGLGDFYSHYNNIHFGQVLMNGNDFLVACTDGLCDALDPVQLFPRPKLIYGLENYDNWHDIVVEFEQTTLSRLQKRKFSGGDVFSTYNSAASLVRKIKEYALDRVLSSTMAPYEDSSRGREEISNPEQERHGGWNKSRIPTARMVLEACIKHAMEVTREDRKLYIDQNFFNASRFEKQKIMEQKVEDFINQELRNRGFANKSRILRGVGFGLPPRMIPFAKIDHLGIQVVQAKICDNKP